VYAVNPDIDTPPDDTVVWRYMNLEKLLALLNSAALHMCRLDQFRDPWEGVWPPVVIEGIRASVAAVSPGLDFDMLYTATFQQKRLRMFVNCWHENPYESAALWDQYANSAGLGLVVRSTIGRIKEACHTDQPFYLGRVRYIDYQREGANVSVLNVWRLAFLKRKSFEHEHEVRLLRLTPEIHPEPDWNKWPKSHSLAVNLAILMESVYLSPRSPLWLIEHTRELLGRFGLKDVAVKRSDLYDPQIQ